MGRNGLVLGAEQRKGEVPWLVAKRERSNGSDVTQKR